MLHFGIEMLCKDIPRIFGRVEKSVLNFFIMLALAIKLTFSRRMSRSGGKTWGFFLVSCLGIQKNAESNRSQSSGVVGIDFVEPQVHSSHCREITVG